MTHEHSTALRGCAAILAFGASLAAQTARRRLRSTPTPIC